MANVSKIRKRPLFSFDCVERILSDFLINTTSRNVNIQNELAVRILLIAAIHMVTGFLELVLCL